MRSRLECRHAREAARLVRKAAENTPACPQMEVTGIGE